MSRFVCIALIVIIPLLSDRLNASTINISAYVTTSSGGEIDTNQEINPAKGSDILTSSQSITGAFDYGAYSVRAGFGNMGLSFAGDAACTQYPACNQIASGGRITAGTVDVLQATGVSANDFISLKVIVDGSVNTSGYPQAGGGGTGADAYYLLQSAGLTYYEASASCSLSVGSPTCASGTDAFTTVLIPFTTGDGSTSDAYIQQSLIADFGCTASPGYPCSYTGDFAHTARIGGATIVDANGNPVQGATLTSVSGYNYSQPLTASPVPEPPSIWLLAMGIVTGSATHLRWRLLHPKPRKFSNS